MEPAMTTTAGIYCKACGYDLRASAEAGRCPECGRVFSPGDPATFRRRPFAAPWKRALGRWAKRGVILLLVLAVLLAGLWGWLYRGWKQEQAAMRQLEPSGMGFARVPLGGAPGAWLGRHVPGSFVLDRVSECGFLPFTDAGAGYAGPLRVAALRDLHRLEKLDLSFSVTDAELPPLATLTQLHWLTLDMTPLTDAGLVHLAPLGQLRRLSLRNTRVTDAGLVHLEKLTALKDLNLQGTQVTPAGVARLKAALPGCTIDGP